MNIKQSGSGLEPNKKKTTFIAEKKVHTHRHLFYSSISKEPYILYPYPYDCIYLFLQ